MIFDVGDSVPISIQVRDPVTGALTDATMALLVTKPDATTTSPSITHPGTGLYQALVVVDQAGLWTYKWTASGAIVAVETGQFTVVTASPARVLVASFTEFKARLNRSDITDDAELRSYLTAATDWAEWAIGGPVSVQSFTEVHWVDTGTIVARRRPIVAVTSITPDQGTALGSASYFVNAEAGTIEFRYGVTRNWHTLIYTAGLSVIAEHIKMAGLEVAKHLFDVQNGSPARGRVSTDLIPTPLGFAVPNRAMELIQQDKVPGIA